MAELAPRTKDTFDERAVARAVSYGLPVVTILATVTVSLVMNVALGLLVLGAGTLIGVIALFWASIRVLSGDAPLDPELEVLEASRRGLDGLGTRKKMLLVALRDLEAERELGKLDADDFAQISATYREELKEVLKAIDANLAPYRGKAEALVEAHLRQIGMEPRGATGPEPSAEEPGGPAAVASPAAEVDRIACARCGASNEPDAKFCKGCGGTVSGKESAEA